MSKISKTVVDGEALVVEAKGIADNVVPLEVKRGQEGARKRGHSLRSKCMCNRCGKRVADKYILARHIKSIHLYHHSDQLTACPANKCSYKHISEVRVLQHVNKVHYKKEHEGKEKQNAANSKAPSSTSSAATQARASISSNKTSSETPSDSKSGMGELQENSKFTTTKTEVREEATSTATEPQFDLKEFLETLLQERSDLPDCHGRIFRIIFVCPFGLLDYGSATLRCKI